MKRLVKSIFAGVLGLIMLACDSRAGTGLSSWNVNNEWAYKYRSLSGRVSARFVAQSDEARIIYRSRLQAGGVEFELYDAAGGLIATFSGNNRVDTIGGLFKKGEKYRVRANVTRAKNGSFHLKMQ